MFVFHPIWVFGRGGGGHDLLMQFSTLYSSKMEIPKPIFFNVLTIHNDQATYVKHALDPLYVFFTLFGSLDGGEGLGHNLRTQFFTLSSSKMENFKTDFF